MTARLMVSAELLGFVFADREFADGVADGEAELACAATVVQKTQTAHTNQSSCFSFIYNLPIS